MSGLKTFHSQIEGLENIFYEENNFEPPHRTQDCMPFLYFLAWTLFSSKGDARIYSDLAKLVIE